MTTEGVLLGGKFQKIRVIRALKKQTGMSYKPLWPWKIVLVLVPFQGHRTDWSCDFKRPWKIIHFLPKNLDESNIFRCIVVGGISECKRKSFIELTFARVLYLSINCIISSRKFNLLSKVPLDFRLFYDERIPKRYPGNEMKIHGKIFHDLIQKHYQENSTFRKWILE